MSNDFEHPPFVDNLISLKGDLRQQQAAGWTQAPQYTVASVARCTQTR